MSLTQINKAGLDEIALDHVFTIGASGNSAYTFQGEGLNGTVNNPTLYLTRGKTYRFENGTGGHPIRIQSTSGASGTAYNTGVTNNATAGTVIVEVQHDAPDVLYYQCTSHAAMNGILYITGALADGGVTTAKIADDAVTDAKLANSINAAIAANTAKTSNATHTGDVTGSTSLTIANDAVTGPKIQNGAISLNKLASDSVGTAKIIDQAVTLAKLPHGTSSNDGKFLRANNGADPTFETVSSVGGANGVTFNDNTAANFGNSNDLQIYHTGSKSLIDSTTTNLDIQSSGAINIKPADAAGITAFNGGAVELYHNGTKRFSTSNSGFHVKEGTTSRLSFEYSNSLAFITANAGNEIKVSCGNGNSNGIEFWDYTGVNKRCQIDAEGIKFNADTAAANGLDDYEEGTFNAPYYQGGTFLANADGRYTKIGNRVFISIFEFVGGQSSKQDKDMLYITGLPFSARSEPNSLGTIARYGGGNHQTIGTAEHCYIAQGGTQIKFDDTFNTGTGNWTVSLVYEAS